MNEEVARKILGYEGALLEALRATEADTERKGILMFAAAAIAKIDIDLAEIILRSMKERGLVGIKMRKTGYAKVWKK